MAFRVIRFETTPNPNAVKCILDKAASDRPLSYFNAEAAAEDPIASALFGIPGVTNVLINTDWISVNKAPEANWAELRPAISEVMRCAK